MDSSYTLIDCVMAASATVVPHRARTSRTVAATYRLTAMLRHTTIAEAPLALTVHPGGGDIVPYRFFADRLWRKSFLMDDTGRIPGTHANLARMFSGEIRNQHNPILCETDELPFDPAAYKSVEDDGYTTAQAYLQRHVSKMLMIGDDLYCERPAPVRICRPSRGWGGYHLTRTLGARSDKASLFQSKNQAHFGLLDEEGEAAFAAAFVDRFGLRPVAPMMNVEIHSADPRLVADEMQLALDDAHQAIAALGLVLDVTTLDDAALEAWLLVRAHQDADLATLLDTFEEFLPLAAASDPAKTEDCVLAAYTIATRLQPCGIERQRLLDWCREMVP